MPQRFPLLVRRGGCGAEDGVVAHKSHSGVNDHPVRSNKEASRHFLDVASTPPHEEGNFHSLNHTRQFRTRAATQTEFVAHFRLRSFR
jgi:hypothetical protein